MKNLYYKRIILSIGFTSALLWGCKDETVNIFPNIVVDKVVNDTINVDDLPVILPPPPIVIGGDNGIVDPTVVSHFVRVIDGNTVTAPTLNNFLDLATGNVYNSTNVLAKQHEVDLLLAHFNTTSKNNLITPDSKEIAYNAYGNDVQRGWSVQNKGLMYRLNNLTADDISWFNGVTKNTQLTKGVDSLIANVYPTRNAIEFSNADARKRLRNVASTSLILFKSLDRGITSAIMVTSGIETTSKDSQLTLNFKTDASTKINVPAGASTLKSTRNEYEKIELNYDPTIENFFALSFDKHTVANSLAAITNPNDINLLVGTRLSGADKQVFVFTPQSTHIWRWKGTDPLAAPYTQFFAPSTMYMRFSVISTLAAYAGKEAEKVNYSTNDLFTYYTAVNTSSTAFSSHISGALHSSEAANITYPYVARLAQSTESGAGTIVRGGVFSILENDQAAGRLVIGYKFSTILD